MLTVKDFHAQWCGPCRMMKPVIQKLTESNTDVKFEFIDVDDDYAQAEKYVVVSVPTIVFLKDGKVVDRKSGVASQTEFQKMIDKHK